MILPTSEYKYTCEWYKRYEARRDAGQLTSITDLPYDVALQDNWLDPTDEHLRYFPVDYQDFWIAADVNSTWNFANNPYGATTAQNPIYRNPRYPRQPQPATYYYDWPNGRWPDYGWLINSYVSPGGIAYSNFGYLCCVADVPAVFANVNSTSYYFMQKGSASGFDQYINNRINDDIYRSDIRIWAALSSVPISSEYALSAPSFTIDLSSKLSAAPHRMISELQPNQYCSYDNADGISAYFTNPNKYPNDFGGWFATSGPITRHQFSRNYSNIPFTESWDTYQSDYGNTIQRITWEVDTSLSAQFCSIKLAYSPRQGEDKKTFRLYINSPTFCYYGDLSADLYMGWNVEFRDTNAQYWKKKTLTFERSPILWTRYSFPEHYLLRSKETFSFEELFCLWSPYDEDDAKSVIADLRSSAGLSALPFTDQPIAYEDRGKYHHNAQAWRDNDYLVWKFSHPLEKSHNYHYTNQDAST